MSDLRRTEQQADGSRVVRKYIGPSTTYAEQGWDAPHNWQDEMTLAPGAVALDFVHPHADVSCSALDDGTGVVINIGGMTAVVPTTIVEELILALETEVDRANVRAPIAKAEREAQGKAQAAQEEQQAPDTAPAEDSQPAPSDGG